MVASREVEQPPAVPWSSSLYYDILSGKTGFTITGEGELMELLTELAPVKRPYDKIASALEEASATGYGVAPEIVRKGSAWLWREAEGRRALHPHAAGGPGHGDQPHGGG